MDEKKSWKIIVFGAVLYFGGSNSALYCKETEVLLYSFLACSLLGFVIVLFIKSKMHHTETEGIGCLLLIIGGLAFIIIKVFFNELTLSPYFTLNTFLYVVLTLFILQRSSKGF